MNKKRSFKSTFSTESFNNNDVPTKKFKQTTFNQTNCTIIPQNTIISILYDSKFWSKKYSQRHKQGKIYTFL